MKKGIDVSAWNGSIAWDKVAKSVDFVMIRSGYGRLVSQKDKYFDQNYTGCKNNNIPIGTYWYNYATTVEDAKTEARACLEVLKGKTFEYPVWYDIEEAATFSTGAYNVSCIAKAFLEIIEAAGYKVGIYSSKNGLNKYFTSEVKNKYDIWVAHVGANGAALSTTDYTGHAIWQYSWTGKIDGINGNVDMNYCYKEYISEVKPAPAPVPETKPVTIEKPVATTQKDIHVYYRSYNGYWLNQITDCNDTNDMGYSGVDNRSISGVTMKASEGTLQYRVHTRNGKWLGWMSKSDINNWATGIAGIKGQVIDGIQIRYSGVPGYKVMYRVSVIGSKNYFSWVDSNMTGYAGQFGNNIDKIQIKIVKA